MMKKSHQNKFILYIGNNLVGNNKYQTAMNTLSNLLQLEGYVVKKTSSKKNKLMRLIDISFSLFFYRKKTDYVLIDTFSTLSFYYAYIAALISRVLKIKYIPILHGGDLPKRLKKSPKKSKAIFNHSYKNVAPSNYLKEAFELDGYKVTLIPNIIKTEEIPFKERKKVAPKLLYVRAFDKIYNPAMAIDVLCKLQENYPEATLCMIGPDRDGSLEKVKSLAKKKKGAEKNVQFLDAMTQKEWYKKSLEFDIFINTTNVDNTPVSIIEAMALGFPIVSTNVGGIPYLIEDRFEGILVEKENTNQMVKAIESILEGKYPNLSLNAREKAVTFGWSVVRNKWLSILK